MTSLQVGDLMYDINTSSLVDVLYIMGTKVVVNYSWNEDLEASDGLMIVNRHNLAVPTDKNIVEELDFELMLWQDMVEG